MATAIYTKASTIFYRVKHHEGNTMTDTTDKARAWDAIAAARRDEREKCAKLAEEIGQGLADGEGEIYIARKIADSIRALSS